MNTSYTYEQLISFATPEATEIACTYWRTREAELLPSFVGLHVVIKSRYPSWHVTYGGFVAEAILIAMQIASDSEDPFTKYHCQLFVEKAVVLYGNVRFHEGLESGVGHAKAGALC